MAGRNYDRGRYSMDGSLEAIEAVRSAREAAGRSHRWRLGEWLGRINTRAAMISILFLVVVGLFASNALTTLSRHSLIIEELGVRSRLADEATATFASSVESYGTTLAGVVAGSVQPNAIASRMVTEAAQLSAAFLTVEHLLANDIDPAAMAAAREALARLPGLADRVQQTFTARRRTDVAALHDEWRDAQSGFDRLVGAARERSRARAEAGVAAARRIANDARIVTLAGVALGIAATILVWIIVVAMITRPVGILAQSMVRVARGDVAAPVPLSDREDQLGVMARAVLVFRENLNVTRSLADKALEGARQTFASSSQASEAMDGIARSAATQLDHLRHHAASLHEAAEAIRQLAESTQQARDRAGDAKLLLDDSLRKIRGLKQALGGGDDDPERVARVTTAIVRMATQTQMLAANAAQEASRVGGDGTGMAMIAEEARQLATRSETLAIAIAEAVDNAGRKGREAGHVAEAIATSANRLEGLVADTARLATRIAASMAQQHETFRTLAERVEVLMQTGQSNATSAAQLTADMVELSRHAADTRQEVESVAAGSRLGRNA